MIVKLSYVRANVWHATLMLQHARLPDMYQSLIAFLTNHPSCNNMAS